MYLTPANISFSGHYRALLLAEKALASTMKTSTSPLRQISGCSMFFVFLILFAHGAFGQETSIQPTMESATLGSSKVPFHPTELPTKKLVTKDTGRDVSSEAPPVSKLLVVTSSHKETNPAKPTPSHKQLSTPKLSTSKPTLPHKEVSTPKHLEPSTVTEQKEPTKLKQTKEEKTTTGIHTSANPETTTTVTATPDKTTKAVKEPHTTVGEPTPFSTTAAAVGSSGLKPRSTKREKEKSTTPGQRVQGNPTVQDTSSRGPETHHTAGTLTTEASEADAGVKGDSGKGSDRVTVAPTSQTSGAGPTSKASPARDSRALTVAIVLTILLLLVLLIAILFCWRRHRHSGSTSFKTAGWAGQAALPDDSGLDKEVEQGTLTAGEGEARRSTLTTFFGKRQSRVPSVAMEELVRNETGDGEETQQLIDGDESGVSSPEGSGEANGKLPEPTVQCSQEKEFPPPPANQEEAPHTQLE